MKLFQCNLFIFFRSVLLFLAPAITACVFAGEEEKTVAGTMIMTPFKWMDSYDDGKVKTVLTAQRAEVEPGQIRGITVNVEFFAPDGKSTGKIVLDNCRYDPDRQKIITDSRVKFAQEGLTVEGVGMQGDMRSRKVDILKDVKVILSDTSNLSMQNLFSVKSGEKEKSRTSGETKDDAFVLTSKALKIDGEKRIAEFLNGVNGTNSQNKFRAEYLSLKFGPTNELQFLRARDNVYLEGTNGNSQCDFLDYDVTAGKAVMRGNVSLVYEDRVLNGSTVNVWTVERRLESVPGKMIISRKVNEDGKEQIKQSIITADNISLNAELSMGFFDGNVIVDDPEISARADAVSMSVDRNNQIKHLAAKGDVEFVQSGRSARSQKAYYLGVEKIIVMIGDAYVKLIDDELRGEQIVYWIEEEKVKCYNSKLVAQMGPDARVRRSALREEYDSKGKSTPIKIFK